MKFKFLVLFVVSLIVVNPFLQASAGCDPCICGPGGDYEGDIGEWFRVNCSKSPRTRAIEMCSQCSAEGECRVTYDPALANDSVFLN